MINPSEQTDNTDHSRLDRDELARICKAMGHPVRMQIIQFLKAETQCFCGELVTRLPLAQSTVSQHLKTLKNLRSLTLESCKVTANDIRRLQSTDLPNLVTIRPG